MPSCLCVVIDVTKSEKRLEVAKEAARLLYYGFATEYVHAKKRAAHSLRIHSLPSNKEVALELDLLADALEGDERKKRLVHMRIEAHKYMKLLEQFSPILKGSVWRGTITKQSDIDIVIYSPADISQPLTVLNKHQISPEVKYIKKHGGSVTKTYVHLNFVSSHGTNVELVIRPPEERGISEKCEIFGDIVKGFTLPELERVLKEDPTIRFLPA